MACFGDSDSEWKPDIGRRNSFVFNRPFWEDANFGVIEWFDDHKPSFYADQYGRDKECSEGGMERGEPGDLQAANKEDMLFIDFQPKDVDNAAEVFSGEIRVQMNDLFFWLVCSKKYTTMQSY